MLASLTSGTESLILIGDHEQLRPKPAEYSLSVDSGLPYRLDVSLFERLLHQNIKKCTLDTQRRMRPEISGRFLLCFVVDSTFLVLAANIGTPQR